MVSTGDGHGGQRRNSGEYAWLTRESMMAARIFRGLESKQTRACAAHDSAPLTNDIRDLTIWDAVFNEKATKQEYHWLKEEK